MFFARVGHVECWINQTSNTINTQLWKLKLDDWTRWQKGPGDKKDYKTSDKLPSIAVCLDLNIFTTISQDYLSCHDLWDQPAVVIYHVTEQ